MQSGQVVALGEVDNTFFALDRGAYGSIKHVFAIEVATAFLDNAELCLGFFEQQRLVQPLLYNVVFGDAAFGVFAADVLIGNIR